MDKKIEQIIADAKERMDNYNEQIRKLERNGKQALYPVPPWIKREPRQQVKKEVDAIKQSIAKTEKEAVSKIKEETKDLPPVEQNKYLDQLQHTLHPEKIKNKTAPEKNVSFGSTFVNGLGLPKSFEQAAGNKTRVEKTPSQFIKNTGEKEK